MPKKSSEVCLHTQKSLSNPNCSIHDLPKTKDFSVAGRLSDTSAVRISVNRNEILGMNMGVVTVCFMRTEHDTGKLIGETYIEIRHEGGNEVSVRSREDFGFAENVLISEQTTHISKDRKGGSSLTVESPLREVICKIIPFSFVHGSCYAKHKYST